MHILRHLYGPLHHFYRTTHHSMDKFTWPATLYREMGKIVAFCVPFLWTNDVSLFNGSKKSTAAIKSLHRYTNRYYSTAP
ncbi:hypothetical protein AN958_05913 [Leucoagaricus sp. SymC.cos]|nr:hypothetical protein AN958_05913 [Leucoagaricus sp. SymC.cos]